MFSFTAHLARRIRWLAAAALFTALASGCSASSVEASAELVGERVAAAEVAAVLTTVPATASAVPTVEIPVVPTEEPVVEPTQEPFVLPTPTEKKNQPVFRQAKVDGDSASEPLLVDVSSGSTTVLGEVSAFTDRVDVLAIATSEAQDLSINWRCVEHAAEDDRPLRLRVEDRGITLSEFLCSAPGMSGSTRLTLASGASLVFIADSNPVQGQTAANMFASYELTLRAFGDSASVAEEESLPEPGASPTPESTRAAGSADRPEPSATPAPTASREPSATAGPQATAVPTTTPEPTTTPTPATAVPTATPEPTAPPEPSPTSGVVVTRPAPVEDEEPAIGDGRVAPADGDSRSNPQRPEQAGFLIGSVSAPNGDASDWSAFTVGANDPTDVLAGVLCENFSGSGSVTVTIYEGASAVETLTCRATVLEEFAPLSLVPGATYTIEATFSGNGYADWFFLAGDDD